jgi:hypothetical protein
MNAIQLGMEPGRRLLEEDETYLILRLLFAQLYGLLNALVLEFRNTLAIKVFKRFWQTLAKTVLKVGKNCGQLFATISLNQ